MSSRRLPAPDAQEHPGAGLHVDRTDLDPRHRTFLAAKVTVDLRAAVEERARVEQRSMSSIVRRALDAYLRAA